MVVRKLRENRLFIIPSSCVATICDTPTFANLRFKQILIKPPHLRRSPTTDCTVCKSPLPTDLELAFLNNQAQAVPPHWFLIRLHRRWRRQFLFQPFIIPPSLPLWPDESSCCHGNDSMKDLKWVSDRLTLAMICQ